MPPERCRTAGVIRVPVGQEEVADSVRRKAVRRGVCQNLRRRHAGAGVDQRRLFAAVHQVDMAVQLVRQAHPKPSASHQTHAFNQFHGHTHP